MTHDYRSTVFLPKTEFAMKASLPRREPGILERWEGIGIYERLREAAQGREKFILHDGPPYANNHLHMGTALNKILKDVINRNQQMLGKDAAYVPGWDCHGLPIEWQIEQQYRKKGRNKDEVPITAFRKECREFASKWLDIQREEFKRLGVCGDWKKPYTTMSFDAEAGIYRELSKFLLSGQLYRGKKSVMWSPVEKTALAEAEVEYQDHTSTTIWVAFPLIKPSIAVLEGASVVIWTTTPWTMPANRAVAYGEAIDYVLVEIADQRLVLAESLVKAVMTEAGLDGWTIAARFKGEALAGSVAAHPLSGHAGGYELEIPMLPADFVSEEDGTGLVHIAPSHGADDFELGSKHGLEVPDTVAEDGTYTDQVPGFVGLHVYKAAEPVCEALKARGNLLAQGKLVHSYPMSWRSKAPLIFRATAQWFIPMDGTGALREKALEAIDETRFVPPRGQNRLRAMIAERPDWCVSRQRAWGVPIAVFVEKSTGKVLRDPDVVERIASAFEEEGADAWWTRDPQSFLGDAYQHEDFERVEDILDVWFDSGSTHATVLEQRAELKWPASLYLEGSDQHRGWFHSSLLESCGTRGRAPYEAVLTHGFVVDGKGEKMSKSKGNSLSPVDLMKTTGADILRLWTVSADYSEDIRIGDEILKGQADAYRRLRNTLRYLLGNLAGYIDGERVAVADMPELERWVLHRLTEVDALVRGCNQSFDFARLYNGIHQFCAIDLSAFYFDVRKDSLYCGAQSDPTRRAARTVLDILFQCLTRWLAPVLVFTAEEAWLTRYPSEDGSVHLERFPDVDPGWRDDVLAARWERVRRVRRVITGALEIERREKRIGSSLQAAPEVYLGIEDREAIGTLDMAELAITSSIVLHVAAPPPEAFTIDELPGIGVVPAMAAGSRCERCWRTLGDVDDESGLCGRCGDAVRVLAATA